MRPGHSGLSTGLVEDVTHELQTALFSSAGHASENILRRLAQQHPYLARVVPVLLDRGDPGARGVAFAMAVTVKSPELLAALRDFGLGQRGPDDMRNVAVQEAMRAGLIPAARCASGRRGSGVNRC